MFMKDGEELVEHPIKGGFQVNPYLTYNWSVHLSAHLAFSHTGMCIHGLCLYIHLHTWPFSVLYLYTWPLSVHTSAHMAFFSTVSVHLAFVCTYIYTLVFFLSVMYLYTWPLSVHVSVHIAFVSTCICTPVCGVSMPHTCTCSFQPVG